MERLIRLILAILACFRLAQFLPYDAGPWGIFLRVRKFVYQKTEEARLHYQAEKKWGWVNELVNCPYCQGVWIALFLTPIVLWPSRLGDLLLTWMAIAGGQAVLQERQEQNRY